MLAIASRMRLTRIAGVSLAISAVVRGELRSTIIVGVFALTFVEGSFFVLGVGAGVAGDTLGFGFVLLLITVGIVGLGSESAVWPWGWGCGVFSSGGMAATCEYVEAVLVLDSVFELARVVLGLEFWRETAEASWEMRSAVDCCSRLIAVNVGERAARTIAVILSGSSGFGS